MTESTQLIGAVVEAERTSITRKPVLADAAKAGIRAAEIEARLKELDVIDAELRQARRRYRAADWVAVLDAAAARKRLCGTGAVTRVTRAKAKSRKLGGQDTRRLRSEAADKRSEPVAGQEAGGRKRVLRFDHWRGAHD